LNSKPSNPYVRTRKISEIKPNLEHSRARPKGGGSLDANYKYTHSKLSSLVNLKTTER
jgi:hypothetical protein